MPKKKTKVDIQHLAQLANLEITPQETKSLTLQLQATIKYIQILNNLDTKKLEPTYQVTGLVNISDEDKVGKSLPQNKYFVTKKIKWE